LPDEVGVQMDRWTDRCQACHLSGEESIPTHMRMTSFKGKREVYVVANRIDNQVACQKCHSAEQTYLGLLLSEYDTESTDTAQALLDKSIYTVGLALLLSIGLIFGVVVRHNLTLPLRRIQTDSPASGFKERRDEIGHIARRQHDLNASREMLENELEFQQRCFNALLSITKAIGDNPSVENVFQTAIEALRQATSFNSIGMRLHDRQNSCLRLIVHYGISESMMEILACVPDNRGFQAEAIKTRWPVFTSDLSTDSRLVAKTALDLGYKSYICVPLIAGEKLIGTMEMVSTVKVVWSDYQVRWLALVGRSIGTLINNVQLTDRLRDFSVMQERNRLAQEIHDGLAQLLGSLCLWAEEAQISFDAEDMASVQVAIRKIEASAQDAYASLREEILGLRDTYIPGKGLIPVLTEFLSRFQRQWGIETCLQANHPQDGSAHLKITPAAEIQLLRMVQEGLTNVRRHAQATRIVVELDGANGKIQLKIQDNGRGFDPAQVGDDRLGIRIMRERAHSVGGVISIQAGPGNGALLTIEIPMESA
jgi:two-component system, NarL family, nitrate/nitrite sensor histidine kinase NarX